MPTPSAPSVDRAAALRARVRRSPAAAPLLVLSRAMRGLPLASEGDTPQQQRLAKAATAAVYNALSRWLDRSDTDFMNYGYVPPDEPEKARGDAVCVGLYRKVTGAADLRGRDVLEIGCGRGGGAAFVARELGPRRMVGVDLSAGAIEHCRSAHPEPNLEWVKGDAEDLPFPAESFDAVLNVESAHGYPSMRRFLNEVHRVLRPEGVMLFADVRSPADMAALPEQFRSAGFAILEDERITSGVVRALERDRQRRLEIVRPLPGPVRRAAATFVGAETGEIFAGLRDGELEYLRFLLRREPSPSRPGSAEPLGAEPGA